MGMACVMNEEYKKCMHTKFLLESPQGWVHSERCRCRQRHYIAAVHLREGRPSWPTSSGKTVNLSLLTTIDLCREMTGMLFFIFWELISDVRLTVYIGGQHGVPGSVGRLWSSGDSGAGFNSASATSDILWQAAWTSDYGAQWVLTVTLEL